MESVVRFSFTRWEWEEQIEILIIDDGSTDCTGIICDEEAAADKRVKVFHIENCGQGLARNYGLRAAAGKYICFADADVWGKTLNETSTPFNNMMELYFEDFDIDGLLAKYESGKYSVRYATELTELAGGQKLVRLYDPSGNLIEVRTPFMSN